MWGWRRRNFLISMSTHINRKTQAQKPMENLYNQMKRCRHEPQGHKVFPALDSVQEEVGGGNGQHPTDPRARKTRNGQGRPLASGREEPRTYQSLSVDVHGGRVLIAENCHWSRWMVKLSVAHPYQGVLLSNKKEWIAEASGHLDGSPGNKAKCEKKKKKKANPKGYLWYHSIYIAFLKLLDYTDGEQTIR